MSEGSRRLQQVAVALSTAAVAWMLAPTFPMTWSGASPAEEGPTTWHSWADPLTLGYLIFPPFLLVAALVAAGIGWYGVVRRRATPAPVVCAGVVVALAVVFFSVAGIRVMWVVPIVLVAVSGVLHGRAVVVSRRSGAGS